MKEIKVVEVKAYRFKKKKYKAEFRINLLKKALKIGLIFGVIMLVMRFLVLYYLSNESIISFGEALKGRFHYDLGETDLSLQIAKALGAKSIDYSNISSVMTIIPLLVLHMFLLIITFIILSFLDIAMIIISFYDYFLPKKGNILFLWFLYSAILGFLFTVIKNMKVKERELLKVEDINNKIEKIKTKKSLTTLILFISITSFCTIKTEILDTKTNNSNRIKELVLFKNIKDKEVLESYDDVIKFSKEQTGKFSKILSQYGIENTTTANGMTTTNSVKEYEKSSNKYLINAIYKIDPDFNNGKLEEGFYFYYEYENLESIEDKFISAIEQTVNDLSSDKLTKKEIKEFIKKAIDKDKNIRGNKENIEIYATPKAIEIYYKTIKRTYKNQPEEFIVENGLIKNHIREFNTINEFKSGVEERWKEDIAKVNKLIEKDKREYYSISVKDDVIEGVKGVEKQFAENLHIVVSMEEIMKDKEALGAKNIYDLVKKFSGVDIGTRENFEDYLYSIKVENLEAYGQVSMRSEFFSQSATYEHPMTKSPLISMKIVNEALYIDVKVPVIAEGKGYKNGNR